MTTVAVDRLVGVMGADRRQTSNDHGVPMSCGKIEAVEVEGGVALVGCAGDEGPISLFLDWYQYDDDENPEPIDLDEDEDFSAVILMPDHTIMVCDRYLRPYEVNNRYYCIGSGGAFAWGALAGGCDMRKAIEVAIACDPYSGNGYDIITINAVQP